MRCSQAHRLELVNEFMGVNATNTNSCQEVFLTLHCLFCRDSIEQFTHLGVCQIQTKWLELLIEQDTSTIEHSIVLVLHQPLPDGTRSMGGSHVIQPVQAWMCVRPTRDNLDPITILQVLKCIDLFTIH